MMEYPHLNDKTREIMALDMDAKLKWIREDHYVFHAKVVKTLQQLEWIYNQRDVKGFLNFPSDLEGITIIGDSGTGKTTIIQIFIKKHPGQHLPDHERVPVAYCILKDSATNLKGLYSSLLSAFNHPYGDADALRLKKITVDQLENALILTLKKAETRIFFIDECQHVEGRNQQSILNMLKRSMLVSRVPMVLVGTNKLKIILQEDIQLADRCPVMDYSSLENWSFGSDFKKFLASYEKFIPLPEPSNLANDELAKAIFAKIRFLPVKNPDSINNEITPCVDVTNLRRITRFLMKLASNAVIKGKSRITLEDIDSDAA